MVLADDLVNDVAAVLDDPDYGRDIIIRKTVPGVYDPATATSTAGTITDTTTRGILLGYKDFTVYTSGGAILRGDRRCIVKVKDLAVEPEIGDQLLADDSIYTVMDVKRVELSGINIIFTLQLRGLSR